MPDTASPRAQSRGRALFLEHCALCHGEHGDGRGARRAGFEKAPADFTSRAWRATTTPADVVRVIRHGKAGTSMPAWPMLKEEQTIDLATFIWSLAESEP